MVFTGTSGNLRYAYTHLIQHNSYRRQGTLSVALYLASLAEVGQGRVLTRVEIAAIAWGVNVLSGVINTVGTKAIGSMSTFNLWWTLGGTLVLVITLLVKAPVKVRFMFPKSVRMRFVTDYDDVNLRTLRNSSLQITKSSSSLLILRIERLTS